MSVKRAQILSPGFEVEASPAVFGISRIYIPSIKDIDKLRALVFSAYEDAIKKKEAGEESEEGSVAG